MFPPFVTPPGTVLLAKLWQPFAVGRDRIWLADLTFPNGWPVWPQNGGERDIWRFVSTTPPPIYDAKGKFFDICGEIGLGSVIKISGKSLKENGRTVLTIKAISVIEYLEPENIFTRNFEALD